MRLCSLADLVKTGTTSALGLMGEKRGAQARQRFVGLQTSGAFWVVSQFENERAKK